MGQLKNLLKNSEFPTFEIDQHIEKTLKKLSKTPDLEQKNEKPKMEYSICLPYVPAIEVLRRKLEKYTIKLYFSYKNKIQSSCTKLMKPQSKSNIYQLACEWGAIYNGETKIGVKKRMIQHDKKIRGDEENSNSEMVQHFYKQNSNVCLTQKNVL